MNFEFCSSDLINDFDKSVSLEKWEWKVDGSRLMHDWGMNRSTTRQLV